MARIVISLTIRSEITSKHEACRILAAGSHDSQAAFFVAFNRIHDVTIVGTRDRITGKVTTETFFGDSPYGR